MLGVFVISETLVLVAKQLSKNGKTVIKGIKYLITFSLSIKILTSACKDLSELPFNALIKGLAGVAGLAVIILMLFDELQSNGNTSFLKASVGMIAFAAALKIMASVCKDLSKIPFTSLTKSLGAITVILVELLLFSKWTAKSDNMAKFSANMIIFSFGMKILASALKDLSAIKASSLLKALATLTVVMLEFAVAVAIIGKNESKTLAASVSIIAMAASMLIIAKAMKSLSEIGNWNSLAIGITALAGSLILMGTAVLVLNKYGGGKGLLGILAIAAALALMAPAFKTLSSIGWSGLAVGLLAIAGTFTILGVAAAVLSPLIPEILMLAGALTLIGVAVLAFGAGVVALGAGLSAVAVGITALAASLVAGTTGIVTAVSVIIFGVIQMIPQV